MVSDLSDGTTSRTIIHQQLIEPHKYKKASRYGSVTIDATCEKGLFRSFSARNPEPMQFDGVL